MNTVFFCAVCTGVGNCATTAVNDAVSALFDAL
jgi:hypothetical protein